MAKSEQKEKQTFYEPACSNLRPVYEWRVDDEGHHYLEQVGEEDFDAEIQQYKDMCDINIIVDRMTKGDAATIAMLAQPGVYGNVNDYPQDVHPVAYAQGLRQLYENQSEAIKVQFGSYEKFAEFYGNLTDKMIAEMFAEKEEVKEDGKE